MRQNVSFSLLSPLILLYSLKIMGRGRVITKQANWGLYFCCKNFGSSEVSMLASTDCASTRNSVFLRNYQEWLEWRPMTL
ncbi:hypothetical protein D4764_0186380 [Takifugu flavidus]|uniref:Secreted protein n=1 Tax=Takifugu flavidus TaxID=433684 RepID=A0A5C6MLC1_9TELE|nr:hypothetical protein D4764_0186380 [Takifugu flavidus]